MKERIIGAVILVIFVVLVVPIFLDGPPEEGAIVSERVLLPGQDGQDTKTVVLNRERSEPIPAPSNAAKEAEVRLPQVAETVEETPPAETEPAPVAAEPQPTSNTVAEAAPKTTSSTGMWAVQLGSFSNKENAEKLAADLRKQGYAAFLSQLQTPSGALHRVRIGPQKDRESAEKMAERLAKVDHKGQVVPHP